MRIQALEYGAVIVGDNVEDVRSNSQGFRINTGQPLHARTVLLATGVRNNRPPMDDGFHDDAVAAGWLRYCPVCDGYEVTDKRIGIIGTGSRGVSEALFLRSYSRDVTLLAPDQTHDLAPAQRADLEAAGIVVIDGPAVDFARVADRIAVSSANGRQQFDTIYPALGSEVHSQLARALGADLGEDGSVLVDSHQRTSIKGLYAAGDVVLGLDQISHAMGEGGVAATTIRNDLAKASPLRR